MTRAIKSDWLMLYRGKVFVERVWQSGDEDTHELSLMASLICNAMRYLMPLNTSSASLHKDETHMD